MDSGDNLFGVRRAFYDRIGKIGRWEWHAMRTLPGFDPNFKPA